MSAVQYELGLRTGKAVWSLYDLFNIFLDPSRPALPEILPCMGDLHYDPVSDESLALMKGWIDDCQHGHQLCMQMPQQVGGPKRLLQCLPDGSVRLVETQSPTHCTQRCGYIALSYCWGDGSAVMKTMEKMLGRHQSGIPDKDLPPLFQEVVALARGVNIPYLWIDSLCIIQDSQEDKEEEMKQMSDIFRGALVVVIAATAESPLDSLLRVSKPQSGQSDTWRTARRRGYEEMDLDVKFRKRTGYPDRPHAHRDATFDTPIARRAWCFQEKLLASRCLVFQNDEVVWECRSCCLCECSGAQENLNGNGWLHPYQQKLLPLAEHESFQLDGTLKYFADAKAAYSFWETAVENYSRRELTVKTDRLPAISAVASIIADATGDRYLAGLWRNDLLAGLAWVSKSSAARPHQEYIAPTWSWASVPSTQYLDRTRHSRDANLEASVLDAWTDVKKDGRSGRLYGPMSEVTDGAIVLSGVHCDVEMTLTIPEHGKIQLDFENGEVETIWYYSMVRVFEQLDYMHVEPNTNGDGFGGNSRYLRRATDGPGGDRQPPCSGTVHLLWLKEDISLILTPSRRKEGAYERLGLFHPGLGLSPFPYEINAPKMPKRVPRSTITLV